MHPGKVHAILLGLVFEKIVENQLFCYKEAVVEIRKGILEERITKQHFIAFRAS
mgnify:FL=1